MDKKISPTEQICMNAMHELVQVKLISRISVQDVLSATGISKATFYRHFTDKYDLYEKMLRRDVDHIFTEYCDLDQWQERIHIWLGDVKKEESIYSRMVRSDAAAFTSFYKNLIYGLLMKRLRRLNSKTVSVSRAMHAKCLFISAGVAALLCDWISEGCAEDGAVIADTLISLIKSVAYGSELGGTRS